MSERKEDKEKFVINGQELDPEYENLLYSCAIDEIDKALVREKKYGSGIKYTYSPKNIKGILGEIFKKERKAEHLNSPAWLKYTIDGRVERWRNPKVPHTQELKKRVGTDTPKYLRKSSELYERYLDAHPDKKRSAQSAGHSDRQKRRYPKVELVVPTLPTSDSTAEPMTESMGSINLGAPTLSPQHIRPTNPPPRQRGYGQTPVQSGYYPASASQYQSMPGYPPPGQPSYRDMTDPRVGQQGQSSRYATAPPVQATDVMSLTNRGLTQKSYYDAPPAQSQSSGSSRAPTRGLNQRSSRAGPPAQSQYSSSSPREPYDSSLMYKFDGENDVPCRGGMAHEIFAPNYGAPSEPGASPRRSSPHARAHWKAWDDGFESVGNHADVRHEKEDDERARKKEADEQARKRKAAKDGNGGARKRRPGDGPGGNTNPYSL